MSEFQAAGRALTREELLRRAGAGALTLSSAALLGPLAGEAAARGSAAGADAATKLAFWWWAEPDAPGADAWLSRVSKLYAQKRGVSVQRVTQSTDTLISAFSAAAKARSGPDLGSQWSGAYVLTQVFAGAITPIASLVPAAERRHWLNAWENEYDGKVWSMPLYLVGSPLIYNRKLFAKAGVDPNRPPTTWDGFLKACQRLKDAGITPIAMGNKDGSAGLYFAANLRKHMLNSLGELAAAMAGRASLLAPKHTVWLAKFKQLVDGGFFNPDISSLGLDEGRALFAAGQGAMTWGTDGSVRALQKQLGKSVVGAMKVPLFAHGKLARGHNATQSTSFFVTSWSKQKQQAADFLTWLHQPAQVKSWYAATGVVPADKRFDARGIHDPLMRSLQRWNTSGPQVWAESFIPTQVVTEGDQVATSEIITKQADAAKAAKVIDAAARKWRSQQPHDVARYYGWVGHVNIPGL